MNAPARLISNGNGPATGPSVSHYCPGGREQGGGIGRLVGYAVDAAATRGEVQRIIDTRGPRWSIPASAPRMARAVAEIARDRLRDSGHIHHIHVAGRGSTLRKLLLAGTARLLGCHHVLHLHDYDYAADFAARPPSMQRRIEAMFRGADAVIVLGERDRGVVCDLIGVDPDRVAVLPNCVPDPGGRAVGGGAVPTILFLGQLGVRKGVPELLEALAGPEMQPLCWRAVLAGDGPLDLYRERAADLGLGDRVRFTGWLAADEIRTLRAEADILALPSHAEGLAMAVLEGLASGLAVVTTRVGAHEEAIIDGRTGAFVPVGDPQALARTLARLVSDPAERRRLGEAGRKSYLERYAIDGYVERLSVLHRSILNNPPVRP